MQMREGKEQGLLSWLTAVCHRCLLGCDQRLLFACVSVGGLLAWLLPWPALCVFVPLAFIAASTAFVFLPGGRGLLKAAFIFALFWALSALFLQLWEHWGQADAVWRALASAAVLGCRLCAMLGFAFALPLCLSPVAMGRVLCWYLQRPALLLRGRLREKALDASWKSGLALAVMAAFLPRSWNILRGLAQTLKLRAPHLKTSRRFGLLGLAALRVLGSQSWDMSVSIASRGLYKPAPWRWRAPQKFETRRR